MEKETVKTTLRSECCNAKTIVESSDDFRDGRPDDQVTHCYICSKCKKPCTTKGETTMKEIAEQKEEKPEKNIFDVGTVEKTMMVQYVTNNKIAEFSKIPTIVKLSMCQNLKQWRGQHDPIKKREIAKKKIDGKWVKVFAKYLPHQKARKMINFCFNFRVNVKTIGEDKFIEYDEEYEKWGSEGGGAGQKATWKKTKSVRTVFEATVIREYTLTDDEGTVFIRPVRASAKAYKNPALSRFSVIESAESKTWTKLAKTFGIGDDLSDDEDRAYNKARKTEPSEKQNNTPPPSNYGY